MDVLEKHLKSTLHAHPVATCDTSMADLIANEWMVAFRPTHDRWGQCCRLEFDNKELCDYAAKIVAGKVARVINYCQIINEEPQEFKLYVVDSTLNSLGIE